MAGNLLENSLRKGGQSSKEGVGILYPAISHRLSFIHEPNRHSNQNRVPVPKTPVTLYQRESRTIFLSLHLPYLNSRLRRQRVTQQQQSEVQQSLYRLLGNIEGIDYIVVYCYINHLL